MCCGNLLRGGRDRMHELCLGTVYINHDCFQLHLLFRGHLPNGDGFDFVFELWYRQVFHGHRRVLALDLFLLCRGHFPSRHWCHQLQQLRSRNLH